MQSGEFVEDGARRIAEARALLPLFDLSLDGPTVQSSRGLLSPTAFRIGKAKAIVATARKIALLVYRCLKGEIVYKDPGAAAYDLINKE